MVPLVLALALLPAAFLAPAKGPGSPPQQKKPAKPAPIEPATKPYKLGVRLTEELTLEDLDGKSHALFAENKGKALVLVFWSYRDPVSRFYAPHLAKLQASRTDKLAVILVNSNYDELVSAGDPIARLKKVLAAEQVTLPHLLDRDNVIADDFGATSNGQAFLVDANRYLRYHGGIDDDPKGDRRARGIALRSWLEAAVDQVLTGQRPKEPWTRPSGRPIKRAPVGKKKAPGGR